MQVSEITSRLGKEKGNLFLYKGHQVCLKDFEVADGECKVHFDTRTVKMPVASVPALLRELLPVDRPPVPGTELAKTETSGLSLQATNVLTEVNGMLLDAMRSVQKNPNYINQAKAMMGVGNVIVNSAKTQVSAAALLLRARGKGDE
jgi:hypothetical protein